MQPIGRNEKCPCGSGKKYKQCCLKKDVNFVEDEAGTIRRSIPMSEEVDELLRNRIDELPDELGRELRPNDLLFPGHSEHTEHFMVEAMKAAGVDPALIHAFEETGLLISEENRDQISDQDFAEWEAAVQSYRSKHSPSPWNFPIGTVALYGPDEKTTTKIVASVIQSEDSEPIMERFVGINVKDDPAVIAKITAFFDEHNVTRVAATDENMGCPHEEGEEFPIGEDCPFCPFWKGKQGSAAAMHDQEPIPGEAQMMMQLMQNMNPDGFEEIVNLLEQCDDEDEFVNMIMVGRCPNCDSESTRDCEDDPEIDDATIGRCDDCGHLWCCDCNETFEESKSAAAHNCPAWQEFDEIDDLDEPF